MHLNRLAGARRATTGHGYRKVCLRLAGVRQGRKGKGEEPGGGAEDGSAQGRGTILWQ